MKLGIISDIHLDQSTYTIYPEDYDADLWINAGDTATNRLMYDYFHTLFPPDKYFFIDGNHDFWGRDIKHPGHYTKSMMIGETRVVSNPRGYPSETHCKHYEPLILEI